MSVINEMIFLLFVIVVDRSEKFGIRNACVMGWNS